MRLTTLIDNKQNLNQLKCEHGLSFLLETGQLKILFDTGQSDKFIHNANKLAIDLSDVDYVVLSHGHYDHAGGIPAFCEINSEAKIIVHQNAFNERFSKSTAMIKENGIPWRDNLSQYQDRIIFIDEDTQLGPDIFILCNMDTQTGYEPNNPRLVIKNKSNYIQDTFEDELILVAQTKYAPLVLCGCAHSGIVNILHTINNRLQYNTFSMVAGGLHLNGAAVDNIKHTIRGLKPFTIKKWGLNHCTGQSAFDHFSEVYSGITEYCGGGYSFNG